MPLPRCDRLLAYALGALLLPAGLHAAEPGAPLCFTATEGREAPPPQAAAPAISPTELANAPIEVTGDHASLGVNGDAVLSGNVQVTQGDRSIHADHVEYDAKGGRLAVDGRVEYRDPLLIVRGRSGRYSATEGADFKGAEFELPSRPARGTAASMTLDAVGNARLTDVTFTTCPLTDPAWRLRADRIDLDSAHRNGVGRGTRVEFKGVPIFYAPWISFPLGTERKSGFLFPGAGYSTRSGAQLSVPYYWNIAPNRDLSFEPVIFARRGIDVAGNFRYLTRASRGKLDVSYLPDDRLFDDDRSYVHLGHRSELPAGWRFSIDAANASDTQYFEDFGQGPEGTSIAFVERTAELTYRDAHWNLRGAFQDFQTIDVDVAAIDRPYAAVPQLYASADYRVGQALQLRYGFEAEVVNFERNVGVTGWRYDAAPHLGLDWQGAGYFIRPALTWRATGYSLEDTAPGADRSPHRSLPTASLDLGLIFEGATGSHGQRRLTVEPRALYQYTPYRNQDALPVFDTAVPDLTLVQLFRTNRYVGGDRIADANQASFGVTSRVLDAASGRQLLAASIGQTVYFDTPRVSLPGEPVTDRDTSDLIAQIALTALRDWTADLGVQWNPEASERERMQVQLQYRPAATSVVNVGYRYQRDRIDQADASVAWPVTKRWSLFGRYIYSLHDDETLDQFAGFEYRSCCWRFRAVGRRFVSSRTGERDTGLYLQLELSGLASVGSSAVSFLEDAIRGYSPASPSL
ncbi:MAG: LPS-assembly protein LptD [Steroidobacteraceae bacterium]|nr:LPS-assembly protein LptD [Steroidobacteraceae bacterium]